MSVRPMAVRILRAFLVVPFRLELPWQVLTPRRLKAGVCAAKIIAKASCILLGGITATWLSNYVHRGL